MRLSTQTEALRRCIEFEEALLRLEEDKQAMWVAHIFEVLSRDVLEELADILDEFLRDGSDGDY